MGRDGGLPREERALMAEDGGHIFFFSKMIYVGTGRTCS